MKKTKDQIISHLKGLLEQKTADCKFYAVCGNIFLFTSIILGFSLYNMDKKFTDANQNRKGLLRYIKREEQTKYRAELCKRLADVSGRSFHVEGLHCTDSKVAIPTDNQIIDAIAHYSLIKTDKK